MTNEVAHHANKNSDGCDEVQGTMMHTWDFKCKGEVVIRLLSNNNPFVTSIMAQ
jgi:hypothetical protein